MHGTSFRQTNIYLNKKDKSRQPPVVEAVGSEAFATWIQQGPFLLHIPLQHPLSVRKSKQRMPCKHLPVYPTIHRQSPFSKPVFRKHNGEFLSPLYYISVILLSSKQLSWQPASLPSLSWPPPVSWQQVLSLRQEPFCLQLSPV